ncbi:MAG TPA: TlpA disulfide reductase family protein [Steroidobacteraceae bacterium]|nr:TlpA disulfide reductase family protein [Steroidobacteraceae bacterium]
MDALIHRGADRPRARAAARVLLAAVAAVAGAAPAVAGRGADVGSPAPAFIVPELDGQLFDLSAERGKVVIVNFWASWCSPCRAEMPLLDSFYKRYRERGLVLLGVSVDDRHDSKEVRRIMQQFSYPAALASDARVDGFGPPLAVPMTWIVDASGVVRARLVSGTAVSEATLAGQVLPLLPQPAAAAQ